jgi:hypothetical protein
MPIANDFQCDMSFPQTCNRAEVRALNQRCATANAQSPLALSTLSRFCDGFSLSRACKDTIA